MGDDAGSSLGSLMNPGQRAAPTWPTPGEPKVRSGRLLAGTILLAAPATVVTVVVLLSLVATVLGRADTTVEFNGVPVPSLAVLPFGLLGVWAVERLWRTGSSRLLLWASFAWIALELCVVAMGGGAVSLIG